MEQFLQVGVISSTHGIRGEVKVFPTTDDPNRFKKLKKVILETKKEKLSLEVQGVKFFKQFVIVKFKGIDNINDIEMYKGRELWIPREEAQELGEDEYYVADLIGKGNERGVKELKNAIHKYRNAGIYATELAKEMIDFEEENLQKMRSYLDEE